MVLSGWFINTIELPMEPLEDDRGTGRDSDVEGFANFFPELQGSKAVEFQYTIGGYIWPEFKAAQLEMMARNPDTQEIIVVTPSTQQFLKGGTYTIKSFNIKRSGPLFTKENGITYMVYPFVLTLVELAGLGENQNATDGLTEEDEIALTMKDINSLIANNGGTPDTDKYGPIEIINNIMSYVVGF